MFLSFGFLWRAGLLVAGIFWCREIFGRLRTDIDEFKEPDGTRRGVLLTLWGLTVLILGLMANFVWGIVALAIHSWNHPAG